MLEGLNPRTRLEVQKLISGQASKLGKETLVLATEAEKKMLYVIAQNNVRLSHETGSSLQEKVLELLEDAELPIVDNANVEIAIDAVLPKWRLGKIVAQSFRGLAPALYEWSIDLEGRCHLLFGPNGSGKTSLLGALSWCLTGKIFRDDSPPSNPEPIAVYSTANEPKHLGERPDALALMDADGQSTNLNEPYWVKLQLLGIDTDGNIQERWLRRDSASGLSYSDDGSNWTVIKSIQEIGLSEMDVEMHVLMPARVPYLRYGKDSHFLTLFSQVVGLDDLEQIAETAGKLHSALVRDANKIEREDIAKATREAKIKKAEVALLDKAYFQGFSAYETYCNSEASEDTRAFGKELVAELVKQRKRLAEDLDIEIPEETTTDAETDLKKKLEKLPGNVEVALATLARPLATTFKNTLGIEGKSDDDIAALRAKLDAFERQASTCTQERLEWAIKEQRDPKTKLMLAAAEHFAEGQEDCPVCSKPLTDAPHIQAHLREMVAFIGKAYLQKLVDDLENSLIGDLDEIITSLQRQSAEKALKDRLQLDWKTLKEGNFSGLLNTIATSFDSKVDTLCDEIGDQESVTHTPLADGFAAFPNAFKKLDTAIEKAWKYLLWLEHLNKHKKNLASSLETLLLAADGSLKAALEKGEDTNAKVKIYSSAIQSCSKLMEYQKEVETLQQKVTTLRAHAASTETIKLLNKHVGDEIIQFVASVEPRIKEFYEYLYDQEHLSFDMLTTGHPANKNIRNDMNVYFKAGSQRVPAAPFTNAGRSRALTISFVFALLDKCKGTWDTLVLDDPVYSFDEEHKSRFLDKLVMPLLQGGKQVVLATHYRTFFEDAITTFEGHPCLRMTPRRRTSERANFEFADHLDRYEKEMNEPTCQWEDMGPNLRKWIETVLETFSSYCPEPFFIRDNLTDSISGYEAIAHPSIATNDRDQIVTILKSREVQRVYNPLAHKNPPTEPETRDAFAKLKECKKAVRRERLRLRQLHFHKITNRQLSTTAQTILPPTPMTPQSGVAAVI